MSLTTLPAPASLTLWLDPRDSAAEHAERLRAQAALAAADKATLDAMRQQWRGESTPKADDRPLWERKPAMELADKLVAECRARAPQNRPVANVAMPVCAMVAPELAQHAPRKPTKAERKLARAAEHRRKSGMSAREAQELRCAAIMSDSGEWLEIASEPCVIPAQTFSGTVVGSPDAGAPLVSIVDRHRRFALVPVSAADAIAERARDRLAEGKGIGARGGACRQITGHAHVPDVGQRSQRIVASVMAEISAAG